MKRPVQVGRSSEYFFFSSLFVFSVPELLLQPSMLGVEQAGLAEVLDYVLKKFDLPLQNRLCQVLFFVFLLLLVGFFGGEGGRGNLKITRD